MKCFAWVLAALWTSALLHADVRSDPAKTPLFTVLGVTQLPDTFDNGPSARPVHHCTIDDKHPLLVVYSLKDFLLEPDKEGVRIVFTDSDAEKFKKLTLKYPLLCLVGGKDTTAATVILKTDGFKGTIMFTKTHYTGPMAVYLRQRFHIAPGTNDELPVSQPPAPSTNSAPMQAAPKSASSFSDPGFASPRSQVALGNARVLGS